MYILNYRAARAIPKKFCPKNLWGRKVKDIEIEAICLERGYRNRSNMLRKRILRSVDLLLQ